MKGNAKLVNVGNRSLRKGEKPKGYQGAVMFPGQQPQSESPSGPTPPGWSAIQRQQKQASSPHVSPLVDDAEDVDPDDEDVEFKQLRGPLSKGPLSESQVLDPASAMPPSPADRLKRLVDRHDSRARSFDSLFGGPETDYVNHSLTPGVPSGVGSM